MNTNDTEYLVDGKYGISDLVDLDGLQRIFESFTEATGFTIGFLDHPAMNVLIATGWRDICTKFHRGCPLSADICTKSNRHLLDQLDQPGKLIIELCDNGLVDCAFPIFVKGKHIASLATGQLLLEKPDLKRFQRQAKLYGFDEQAYLMALDEIPVVSEEKLRSMTTFLGEMSLVLAQIGYAHLTAKEESVRLEREITARKQAEALLRQSEAQFRALTESSPVGIYFIQDGKFEYVNPAMAAVFGYSVVEMTGMAPSDITHPDYQVMVEQSIRSRITGEVQLTQYEVRAKHRDGSPRDVEIYGKRVVTARGAGIIGTLIDITERKRVAAEHAKLQSQFIQAQKMESVGRLAGGVAHDFNNLLMAIMGNAAFARDELPTDHPVRCYLDEITKEAQRSADLTKQLLAFSRQQIVQRQVLNFNDAVEGMLKMLRRLIGEDISVNWSPGQAIWQVLMDPSQIDQILINLGVNARDAIGGVGAITIETVNITLDPSFCSEHPESLPGDYVMLAVSDTGCGMNQETAQHIFGPFFTTKPVGAGTGLGLATVYGIVKQNNGYIDFNSGLGKGTTFRIYLPRFVSQEDNRSAVVKSNDIRPGNETILLVEDDQALRGIICRYLRSLGYTVLVAESPEQALRMVPEHPGKIHLLVADVVMPGMNGLDLAHRLSAERPELKTMFISGFTADIIAQRGIMADGMCFLPKPFSRDELSHKVRQVLDSRQ